MAGKKKNVSESEWANRFWKKVDTSAGGDECWQWMGGMHSRGYGRMRWKYGVESSHRIAWELTNGAVPAGLHVLHKCDNRACCNPAHLWLGTQSDNMQDKVKKEPQYCNTGAPWEHVDIRVIPRTKNHLMHTLSQVREDMERLSQTISLLEEAIEMMQD